MGCDIHFYVEKKIDGKWLTADEWEEEDGRKIVDYKKSYYHDRNYDLFSILANVRNGFGFAGVNTGDGFVPIAMPRGVPEDACDEYKAMAEQWDGDGHSHSYVTVSELLAYDWTQTTHKAGIVDIKGLAQFKINGAPSSWSGGVAGKGIEIFPAAVGIKAIDDLKIRWWDFYHAPGSIVGLDIEQLEGECKKSFIQVTEIFKCQRPHFQVEWEVAYYESAQKFLGTVMPRLWRLGNPEEVRCCFFFDN